MAALPPMPPAPTPQQRTLVCLDASTGRVTMCPVSLDGHVGTFKAFARVEALETTGNIALCGLVHEGQHAFIATVGGNGYIYSIEPDWSLLLRWSGPLPADVSACGSEHGTYLAAIETMPMADKGKLGKTWWKIYRLDGWTPVLLTPPSRAQPDEKRPLSIHLLHGMWNGRAGLKAAVVVSRAPGQRNVEYYRVRPDGLLRYAAPYNEGESGFLVGSAPNKHTGWIISPYISADPTVSVFVARSGAETRQYTGSRSRRLNFELDFSAHLLVAATKDEQLLTEVHSVPPKEDPANPGNAIAPAYTKVRVWQMAVSAAGVAPVGECQLDNETTNACFIHSLYMPEPTAPRDAAEHPLPFPQELMLEIFSYLSMRDRVRCRAVCRAWRDLASDGALWRVLDVDEEPMPIASQLEKLVHALYVTRNVRRINLGGQSFTRELVCLLRDECDALEELNLQKCILRSHDVAMIARHVPTMRCVNAFGLENFVPRMFTELGMPDRGLPLVDCGCHAVKPEASLADGKTYALIAGDVCLLESVVEVPTVYGHRGYTAVMGHNDLKGTTLFVERNGHCRREGSIQAVILVVTVTKRRYVVVHVFPNNIAILRDPANGRHRRMRVPEYFKHELPPRITHTNPATHVGVVVARAHDRENIVATMALGSVQWDAAGAAAEPAASERGPVVAARTFGEPDETPLSVKDMRARWAKK